VKGKICTVFGNHLLRIVCGTEREEVGGVGTEGRAGHTESRKQNRNMYEILVPDLIGRNIFEDLGLDGRMLI
jgi:hypothetical protein